MPYFGSARNCEANPTHWFPSVKLGMCQNTVSVFPKMGFGVPSNTTAPSTSRKMRPMAGSESRGHEGVPRCYGRAALLQAQAQQLQGEAGIEVSASRARGGVHHLGCVCVCVCFVCLFGRLFVCLVLLLVAFICGVCFVFAFFYIYIYI